MRNKRLGCLTGTGLLAALITALVIAGYAYARGGLMYNPGPLNTHGNEVLGGVSSHAETGGNCNACHAAPWELATMADRCAACHTEIAEQMRAVASMHGTLLHNNPALGCRDCHPEHRGPDASLTELNDAAFPHEAVGFSLKGHQLTAARKSFTCQDCHADDISRFDWNACDICHRQMDAAFMTAHTLSYGTACQDCHDGVDRFGESFDHNRFSFKIKGRHVGLACHECHFTARGLNDFPITPQDCSSCHQKDDPHEGRFGAGCVDCHTENGWKPAKFDHSLAAFKLEGEHQEVPCGSCHIDNVLRGTPSDCHSCHKEVDAHEGRFGSDCSICHTASSWDNVSFDHSHTSFPLTGAHANVACERCHTSGQFQGLSAECASCHGDPAFHAGMFSMDCASCHTTANWFAPYTGPHPGIADEGGSGVNHGGASCRDCHTQTLREATCLACHDSNNPDGEGGEEEEPD